jgi:hypothetical protein
MLVEVVVMNVEKVGGTDRVGWDELTSKGYPVERCSFRNRCMRFVDC